MARGRLLLACTVVAGGLAGCQGDDRGAGCAIVAPALPYVLSQIPSGTIHPGEALVVTGGGFNDARTGSDGCLPDAEPSRDVTLVLSQGPTRWELGTVDAGPDLRVRWEVRLPADLRPGVASFATSKAPDTLSQVLDVLP